MGLKYTEGCRAFVRSLAPEPKQRLRAAVQMLVEDARHPELDLKRLRTKGERMYYRCRVGDYRIICTPVPGGAVVWRIIHRADGYEWLDAFDPYA